MRILPVLISSMLVAAMVAIAAPASAVDTQPVTVEIFSTSDITGDIDSFSPGDFYAQLSIGTNPVIETPHQDFSGGIGTGYLYPFTVPTDWVATGFVDPAPAGIPVIIVLKDEDDIAGGSDDTADISPAATDGLFLTVDVATGAITGDLTSTVGNLITAVGTGDERAEITFRITLNDPLDSDGDGLSDDWEINGHPNGLDLAALGADPMRRDLFLEIDCMSSDGDGDGDVTGSNDHVHCLSEPALRLVVAGFARAPLSNPDGTTGVQLHIDTGTSVVATVQSVTGIGGVTGTYGPVGGTSSGGGEFLPEAGNTIISLTPTSTNPTHWSLKSMDPDRMPAFRYGLVAHQVDARRVTGDCTGGVGELAGNDFIVSLGGLRTPTTPCWGTDSNGFSVGSTNQQAGTLMHELGHNLGLRHGGADPLNNKPNYFSVMNYRNLVSLVSPSTIFSRTCGVPQSFVGSVVLPGGCDFSRVDIDLNELSPGIDECLGVDAGGFLAFGQLDFDADGNFQGNTCATGSTTNLIDVDVNADKSVDDDRDLAIDEDGFNGADDDGDLLIDEDGALDPLNGFDDWNNIFWRLTDSIAFDDGSAGEFPLPVDFRPEDLLAAQALVGAQTAPDLVGVIDAPASARNGDVIDFSLLATNVGRGPALLATALVEDPDGVELAAGEAELVRVSESFNVAGTYTVPEDACPSVLALSSSHVALGMSGLESETNAAFELEVLDVDAPSLSVSAQPGRIWPPNHKMVKVEVTVESTDRCDLTPAIRLESITSNQPANGQGDGNTSVDIQAEIGTDDRSVLLRAERSRNQDRVYRLVYSATDASGNSTSEAVEVRVARR